ncbi:MAG: flippase-like domain-containing protein [Flavobacteriales bacterium]|nr:flippase-like domain-containing protein [Flavobacteriales bacterium]
MTRRTLLLVRLGVFLAAGGYLCFYLAGAESTHRSWGDLRAALGGASAWFWPLMLALTGLNWGMEAWKWRWLVAGLEPMRLSRAYAATLAGASMGIFTPNRAGEPVGRVLFLAPENRWQGGLATVLGSMSQLVATLLAGTLALLWWRGGMGAGRWWEGPLLMLAALAGISALLLFLRPQWLGRLVRGVPVLRKVYGTAGVVERYAASSLLAVLGMSLARYVVFWLQYVLFLTVLGGIAWQGAAVAVPLIFLAMALLPTMLLSELGVRGSVAVALLAPMGGSPAMVVLASFGVWAVNLALPAAVGAVILLVARIRSKP